MESFIRSFQCVETEILFLTGNAIKYFSIRLVLFTLPNVMSVVVGNFSFSSSSFVFHLVTLTYLNVMSVIVSNFPLSANSFVPMSTNVPVVVTKYAKCPLCTIARSDLFNRLEVCRYQYK